eukprot:358897-Chlamydomonas_euryale.AAC.4
MDVEDSLGCMRPRMHSHMRSHGRMHGTHVSSTHVSSIRRSALTPCMRTRMISFHLADVAAPSRTAQAARCH